MGESVTQENFASTIINLSDDAVLVTADVENRVLSYLIRGLKGSLEIGEHRPIGFFRYEVPVIEATLRFGMN
jgi:hypothetical protein